MAKIICMFALAGLAAGAPSPAAIRVSPSLDQETVISKIMSSLQPSIDAAIAKALGDGTYSSVAVQETVGPVQYAGSVGNTNYKGSYGAEKATFSSAYESNSAKTDGYGSAMLLVENNAGNAGFGGATYLVENVENTIGGGYQPLPGVIAPVVEVELEVFQLEDQNQNYAQQAEYANQKVGSSHFQSAGAGGVVYHDAGKQQLNTYETIANQGKTEQVNSKGSVSVANQQQLVQGVMSALVPSIEAAVQAALFNMQQSAVSSSSITSGSQQNAGFSTSSASSSASSQSLNEAEERTIVTKIIEALTPSITTSVRKALAQKVSASQQSTSAAQGSTHFQSAGSGGVVYHDSNKQSSLSNVNQAQISSLQSTTSHGASHGAVNTGSSHFQSAGAAGVVYHDSNKQQAQQSSFGSTTSSQSNTQSSQQDSSKLVAQIVAALKPSISLSVQEALKASSLTSSQNSQAFNTGSSFTSQSAGFNSQSSGGSLASIFGDGKAHNVRVETPQYKVEYSN